MSEATPTTSMPSTPDRESGPPTIAVVMPAHRAGPDLDRALAAIVDLDPQPDEVIIVVDGGDEAVTVAASKVTTAVIVIDAAGPAAARNAGVAGSHSDVVLFVDSDVAVRSDVISRVRSVFDHHSTDAMFGSYDDQPDAQQVVSRFRNLLHHWTHQHARHEASTFWAGCGAVRRSVFDAVGGFDASKYRDATIEDIELGARLTAAGHRIVVEPSIQVTHLKRWTLRSMVETDVAKRGVPWMRLMLADGAIDDDLNTTKMARLRVLVSGLFSAALATTAMRLVPWRRGGLSAIVLAAAAVWLDRGFLAFARRIGGLRFAAASAGLMWIHHVSAGVAACWALVTWPIHRNRNSR